MRLAKLDQLVLLDRGQAQHVHLAGHAVHLKLLGRILAKTERLSTTEALALRPFGQVLLKLDKLSDRDARPLPPPKPTRTGRPRKPRPAKPHRLRLSYDQLVAVRCFYARILEHSTDAVQQLVLCTALARFHQPSLSLEHVIRLPEPTGPGAQFALL